MLYGDMNARIFRGILSKGKKSCTLNKMWKFGVYLKKIFG